jgi:hypothetical protein
MTLAVVVDYQLSIVHEFEVGSRQGVVSENKIKN